MLVSRMSRQSGPPRDAQLLQGTLDMLILKICALEPIHGYGIVHRLQRSSSESRNTRQATLYPALYRLESKALLKAEWHMTEGGREAKYYSLTAAGRKQLEEERAGWKRLCDAIALVLDSAK